MSSNINNDNDENERVWEALVRLQTSLKDLPDKQNAPHLTHWRVLPESVTAAYDYITKGTELVKATSTKYTLVGKIDATEGSKLAKELLQGCELISTGVLVLCNDVVGCAKSTRHFANQAARAVVHTTIALIETFRKGEQHDTTTLAAQKTGAVWSTCNALLKVPRGNRNAIRRELFTYIQECNETLHEFDTLLQSEPRHSSTSTPLNTIQENDNDTEETLSLWDDFFEDNDEQYREMEVPVATASLCLIKCSRGSLNVTLQACEAIGNLFMENNNTNNDTECSINDENVVWMLDWIQKLTSLAQMVGEEMTNLGTCLYPPLQLHASNDDNNNENDLVKQLLQQRDAVVALNEFVLDAPTDLPEQVTELASKLKNAANTRFTEAMDAIDAAAAVNVGL